jgi:glycosyltransferase involved in cell wall biosynthesis
MNAQNKTKQPERISAGNSPPHRYVMNNEKKDGGLRTRGLQKSSSPEFPLISIVTVVLNGAAHLEHAIRSVIEQDYPNIEYIIIDGGSKDGTLDIIRTYENRIDYWLSEPDRGISDAFNKGITRCSGELIGTINADDSYLPGAVSLVAAAHREGTTGLIICGGMIGVWGKKTIRIAPRPWPHMYWYFDTPYYHPASFVPRIVYEWLGAYDLDYHYAMDYEFFLRADLAGVLFHRVPGELTRYSFGGRSGLNPLAAYREVFRAQREHGLYMPLCAVMYCLKFFVNRLKWLHKTIER